MTPPGFVMRWSYTPQQFILTVDADKYEPGKSAAVIVSIRTIFDWNKAPLPKDLVLRGINGKEYGRWPFANAPSLVK